MASAALSRINNIPKPLASGGNVFVPSVAGSVQVDYLETGIERLRDLGFEVSFDATRLNTGHPYLAAPDDTRLDDLERAFADQSVDAIVCARGGYGSIRLLDRFDVCEAARSGKAFMGFSDITALHLALNKAGLVTFHGPVVTALGQADASEEALNRAIGLLMQRVSCPETIQGEAEFGGRAEGRLLGGNLSLLSASLPLKACALEEPTILLIEEVSEPLYRIDRMITGLRLSHLLDPVVGFALGSFSDCGDGGLEGEREAARVAAECLQPLGKPIICGLPVGHANTDVAIPLGVPACIDGADGTLTWEWGDERRG